DNEPPEMVAARPNVDKTALTAWFEANSKFPNNNTTYCHDLLPTSGTQPRPRDSNPPKTIPTTTPGLDRYLANSPSHHRPSPPVATTATATRGIPRAITAVIATLAPGLGYHTTSALAPPITPGPR
ncbi:hypothetical protein C0993_001734, partial [Termitomyces sp. T159_Od127]